jgi:hypothetical protein
VEETEDVVETSSQLDAEHSAFWAMLIVLGVRQDVEFKY